MYTFSSFGERPSPMGLKIFMVDIAGALVSPRMSFPRRLGRRGRGIVEGKQEREEEEHEEK